MDERRDEKGPVVLICLALAVIAFGLYWPTVRHPFTNLDDPEYVLENPAVLSGLTAESVRWAFTTGHAANWHPVTWLSHMTDIEMFGLRAGGHHLVNVLLHTVNSALVLVMLWRLSGRLWRSAFVAAVFAVHPLHVESVAWVAERKDLLSGLFFILTFWAYGAYVSKRSAAPVAADVRRGNNSVLEKGG